MFIALINNDQELWINQTHDTHLQLEQKIILSASSIKLLEETHDTLLQACVATNNGNTIEFLESELIISFTIIIETVPEVVKLALTFLSKELYQLLSTLFKQQHLHIYAESSWDRILLCSEHVNTSILETTNKILFLLIRNSILNGGIKLRDFLKTVLFNQLHKFCRGNLLQLCTKYINALF